MRTWLRELRNNKNLTMKDMGSKLGVSESYYCAIEAGTRQKKMDMSLAAGLASILDVSVYEIVRNEQELKLGAKEG